MRRILLVEDDESLAQQVLAHLRRHGFEPTWVSDGTDALKLAPNRFSLIILDLMLPGTHGLDVLKHVRKSSDVPVLVLSARNETADKVRALKIGADDFVTKPFWPDELLERVNARLRRPMLMRGTEIRLRLLVIDVAARSAHVRKKVVDLTRVEFDLLATLAKRMGESVSRSTLATAVFGPDGGNGDRTLDVHMSRLRKKLGEAGKYITTVWGVGYRLQAGEPS